MPFAHLPAVTGGVKGAAEAVTGGVKGGAEAAHAHDVGGGLWAWLGLATVPVTVSKATARSTRDRGSASSHSTTPAAERHRPGRKKVDDVLGPR